ncbi:MAG: NTP transferase domain-containing protein [Clostridia bacterium]|nr:NTP transferase domain-containing protein [Clostridia bacterium]
MKEYLISGDISVRDAMKKLDATAEKIVFVVADNKLCAAITDGDIRRYLMNGGTLEDSAIRAANCSPKSANSIQNAKALYHKKNYVAIPVVNADGVITSIYTGEKDATGRKPTINLPVVINAGGKGSRLDPYTRVLPKPLIPVGELPIIEHIMQAFLSYGCNDFHMIVNYKKQLIKSYFGESENQYNIAWYDEDQPLGTGGGLSLVKGKINSTFIFANCDTLMLSNYDSMVRFHKEHHNLITMIAAYKNVAIPYGIIEMGKDGIIEEMKEKPEMSFLANTGMYIVEPEVLDYFEDAVRVDFPVVIEKIREQGERVAVYPVSEHEWLDMGQLPELEKMRIRLCKE